MQPGSDEPAQPALPRPRAAFFTSFALGAAIWALSPLRIRRALAARSAAS